MILKLKLENFQWKKIHPIECGFLVDTQEKSWLPTLHNALQSALSSSKSCLLAFGAVCSAVFMRNNLYMFFDSHSHGEHGLSSVDGKSILISFSSLDDLDLYAFYDSMKIDMNLQFDLMPVNVRNFDAVAQWVTDESIPENMTIPTENAKDTLQLQGKCHTESFAECITKEAEYFALGFLWKLLYLVSILLIMFSIYTRILMIHLQRPLLVLLRHLPKLMI